MMTNIGTNFMFFTGCPSGIIIHFKYEVFHPTRR